MATQTINNFNSLDFEALSAVEGGLSDCAEGTLALGGIGSTVGPWGALGGVLVGVAYFCL